MVNSFALPHREQFNYLAIKTYHFLPLLANCGLKIHTIGTTTPLPSLFHPPGILSSHNYIQITVKVNWGWLALIIVLEKPVQYSSVSSDPPFSNGWKSYKVERSTQHVCCFVRAESTASNLYLYQ